jgi:hypothetical protein
MLDSIKAEASIELKDPHVEFGNVVLRTGLTLTIQSSQEGEVTLNWKEVSEKLGIELETDDGLTRIEAVQKIASDLTMREYKRWKKIYDKTPRVHFE